MAEPDIVLSTEDRALFDQIRLEWDHRRDDSDAFNLNAELVAQLMGRLVKCKAIPDQRLKYFVDPEYRTGRIKGSHRDLFIRNGRSDDEIVRHPHFLPFLRYFVCGPDLPSTVVSEFREAAQRCGQVSGSDALELGSLARKQVRAYGLASQDAAEEYIKLALDCGIYVGHALTIGDRVKKLR